MAHMRWPAEKIGKQNIVAHTNDAYGIADRVYVTNQSKARELTDAQLAKVNDPYCVMSLQLQAAFGLRREESLKIRPDQADQGNVLHLQASWCKDDRAREIPIRSEEQRQLLDAATVLANGGSLIPADFSYKEGALTPFPHAMRPGGDSQGTRTPAPLCAGSISPCHQQSALDALLRQAAKPKPRNCMTGSKRKAGASRSLEKSPSTPGTMPPTNG